MIAEANGKKLFLEEVIGSVPRLSNKKDSVNFLNRKAEAWTRDQTLLAEAEKTISSSEIDRLVSNYKDDLIIAQFENSLVQNNLDTLVSENEIEEYIAENKMKLKKGGDQIKVKFGKVRGNKPKLESLDSLWNAKNWEEIRSYCGTFAEICLLEDRWISLTELQQYFSKEIYSSDVLKKKGYSQRSGSKFEYFLTVIDHKKGMKEISAADKEKVSRLILHSRSVQLLKEYKEKLYQESLDKQKIKFYLN